MSFLLVGVLNTTWQQLFMFGVGGILIYLAIAKKLEPALLLPMGFGAILVNLPSSGAITQSMQGIGEVTGILDWLFSMGIDSAEAMPLLLFIGIGAMIDFGPLLANPKLILFGAAAQWGIFATISLATLMGFSLVDAASIGIIGAADGPTSILVSQVLGSKYIGPIAIAAYSYMAMVPHHPALCHQAGDHQEGAGHQDGVQPPFHLQAIKDTLSHHSHHSLRLCGPCLSLLGRNADVR